MQEKKLTKSERRAERLRKGRQWVASYEGSHIVRDYSERFKVDVLCAMDDLGKIGALNPEKLAAMKEAEIQRREKKSRTVRNEDFRSSTTAFQHPTTDFTVL